MSFRAIAVASRSNDPIEPMTLGNMRAKGAPRVNRAVGIMTLKNRMLSPLAQLFIACAREVAKPLAAAGRRVRAG